MLKLDFIVFCFYCTTVFFPFVYLCVWGFLHVQNKDINQSIKSGRACFDGPVSVKQQFKSWMGRVEWGCCGSPAGTRRWRCRPGSCWFIIFFSVFLILCRDFFLSAAELRRYHTRMPCVRTLGKSTSTLTLTVTVTSFSVVSGSTVFFLCLLHQHRGDCYSSQCGDCLLCRILSLKLRNGYAN